MTFGQSLFLLGIISLLTALFAKERGRDPYIWFVFGLFGSFFALIILFLLPNLNRDQPKEKPKTIDVEAVRVYPEIPFQEHDWFYLDSERKSIGPLPFAELKELFRKGSLTENTLVWNEGETEWKKISAISGLIDSIKI